MKYRYYVSYFCKLKLGDSLGIKMDGHIETSVYELSHPLTTKEEVDRFSAFLQTKSSNPKLFDVILLSFSLMYVEGYHD